MAARWSCSSAEAIAFRNLETRLLNDIGAPNVPSCEQTTWWQDAPSFWRYLLVNNGGAGIQEAVATDAADIASRLASMAGLANFPRRSRCFEQPPPGLARNGCEWSGRDLNQRRLGARYAEPVGAQHLHRPGRLLRRDPCGSLRRRRRRHSRRRSRQGPGAFTASFSPGHIKGSFIRSGCASKVLQKRKWVMMFLRTSGPAEGSDGEIMTRKKHNANNED